MAVTIKYPIGSLRLRPAPIPPADALKGIHPALATHLQQSKDWNKQAEQSIQQLASAVRELQGIQTGPTQTVASGKISSGVSVISGPMNITDNSGNPILDSNNNPILD